MTYTCKLCDKTSDAVEFYKGVTSRCKECHKQKVRENRAEKADYYRAYDAKRFQEDPRVLARRKRYLKTDAGIKSMRKARSKWKADNSDKRAASTMVGNAVRGGRLEKPNKCQVCGNKHHRIHGHHDDYTKPLDVVWCCPQCHHDIHEQLKKFASPLQPS